MKMRILVAMCIVIVLAFPCVASAEDGNSSFVTYSDGLSYDGLPAFPTEIDKSDYVSRFTNYMLYYDTYDSMYYLLCFENLGNIYLDNNRICTSGYGNRYTFSGSFLENVPGNSILVYRCAENDVSWTEWKRVSSRVLFIDYCDKLLQTSCDIYADYTLTSVFTKPAREPLMSGGLSARTIVETMKKMMVSLIPSVIGLLVLVIGLRKSWSLLVRALRTC